MRVLNCIHMTQVDYRQAGDLYQLRSGYGTNQNHVVTLPWHPAGAQQALLTIISITLTQHGFELAQPMLWASVCSQTTLGDFTSTILQYDSTKALSESVTKA